MSKDRTAPKSKMKDVPVMLIAKQAASQLGISMGLIAQWVDKGRIKPCAKIPKRGGLTYLFKESDVNAQRKAMIVKSGRKSVEKEMARLESENAKLAAINEALLAKLASKPASPILPQEKVQ